MPEAVTDNECIGRKRRICAELADVALKKQRLDKTCVKSEKEKDVNGKDGQNGQNGQNGRDKTKTKLKTSVKNGCCKIRFSKKNLKQCEVKLLDLWLMTKIKQELQKNHVVDCKLFSSEKKKKVVSLKNGRKNGGKNSGKNSSSVSASSSSDEDDKPTKGKQKIKTKIKTTSSCSDSSTDKIEDKKKKTRKKQKPSKNQGKTRKQSSHKQDSDKSPSSASSSDSESNWSDASGEGVPSDAAFLNQKQARILVKAVQEGRTSKKLPTRVSELFAPWQISPKLRQVNPQAQDMNCTENPPPIPQAGREKLRVISLFDGISTALVALKSLGLEVEKYYASEVDGDAMKCSKRNHPEVVQIGDVRSITEQNLVDWGPFDLLVGGSPCNDFSRANPHREGFTGKWGKLFFDYARVLAICKEKHEEARRESPFYWLFENVIMDTEDKVTISYTLGCDPVSIDAMYVSPMRRQRLYWSNIPGIGDPVMPNPKMDRLYLQECLEPGRKARVKRIGCITTRWLSMLQGKFLQDPVIFQGKTDKLWSVEIERCFGFPDHYTDVANLSADRRMGLLGMSWSIPCIRHLFQPLLMYFKSGNCYNAIL